MPKYDYSKVSRETLELLAKTAVDTGVFAAYGAFNTDLAKVKDQARVPANKEEAAREFAEYCTKMFCRFCDADAEGSPQPAKMIDRHWIGFRQKLDAYRDAK